MNDGEIELPGEEKSCLVCGRPGEIGDHAHVECGEGFIREAKKYIELPRQHASSYNWHDKQQKEKGIVQTFLEHRGETHSFIDFEMTAEGKDPPDAWVFESEGERTALEITELVNQSAIDAQIHGQQRYSAEQEKWSDPEYFQENVNKCVTEKDKKCEKLFADGRAVQLLLHSDEMYVEAFYSEHLDSGFKLTGTRFQTVWLLLSYDSFKKTKPLVRLTERLE